MTMRLDIVTNDAGEGVRREHARELGAGVVISIYRLAKLAQMHDLANQAFTRQLEQTHQIIGDYCLRSGSNVNVMFAHRAIFVAGQLLKGSRSTYEAATELGELFERLGGSELYIQRDVTREELLAFAEQISSSYRGVGQFRSPTPKIRLRAVADSARLRGLELEDLSPDQRIVRMYASAIVIIRRFFEDLQASRYILPRRIKRIAQSLVDLSEGSTPSFLGVTEVRNANFDEAGRAVNTAILAVSMAREVTQERAILSQIAMAAMMHDVARPRALALIQAQGSAIPGMQAPTTISEDQEDRLAAGAAAVLTALGRVNEPSITRTVLTFEALWLRRQQWLGPVYWGARAPTLHAKLIAIARRYNDLLTPEPGLLPPTPDYAVAALSEELKEAQDRTALRMLVSALGLLPMGTVVQLATGEVAEVVRGPKGPGERARVRLVTDQNGQQIQPVEIELAQEPQRQVVRVMSVEGWRKGLELRQEVHGEAYGDEKESLPPPQPQAAPVVHAPVSTAPVPPPLAPISPLGPLAMPPPGGTPHSAATSRSISDQYADQYASWSGDEPADAGQRHDSSSSIQSGESSASLPSMGSSPSAVAEAMGRMINDSLKPPAPASHGGPDRTVMQASNDDIADRVTNRPAGGRHGHEPTARGNLAATPLPHVLVYMLDHSLTGSVVFEGGDGEDTIYFVSGVPTKIRLNDEVALLGQILVHGGAIETKAVEQAVEGARRLGILLGEYLVGHDLVSREALLWALEAQLLNKIAYLANLAPEISYSYYREMDLLEGWGGGDVPVACALNPILASVRNWLDRGRIRATLNRIGKHPLVLHDDSALENLALLPEEGAALDMIRAHGVPLAQLFTRNVADEEVVSSLVYSLAVTRQFAFKGQKKGPMASKTGQQWKAAAATSSKKGVGSVPPIGSVSVPIPSSASAPPSASSKKPAAPIPIVAVAPPPSRTSLPAQPQPQPPSARSPAVAAPPPAAANVRKPGEPAAAPSPAPAPRAMAPAARPAGGAPSQGLVRASAPQIRPITAKKATMIGIQPAATSEQRAGGAAAKPASAPSPEPPKQSPSMNPPDADGAKTIARPSPAFLQNIAKKAAAAAHGGPRAAGVPPNPSSGPLSRPSPALPSKVAAPRPGAASTSAKPVPGAPISLGPTPTSLKTPPKVTPPPGQGAIPQSSRPGPAPPPPKAAPAPALGTNGTGGARDDFEIELDDHRTQNGVVDIGDDGLADAEAALEAMQSFRLAEAALQRNDIAAAEKLATKAADGDPTQTDYVTLLAWIRAQGNDPWLVEEAIATLSRVLADDPASERALLYRGKLLARVNRANEALADLNELLLSNPQHRDALAEVRQLKLKTP